MAKTKNEPKQEVKKDFTYLTLEVPNDIYDDISNQARQESRKTGLKKTIKEKAIEILDKGRKVKNG